MTNRNYTSIYTKTVERFKELPIFIGIVLLLSVFLIPINQIKAQSLESIKAENVIFKSEGVSLEGTIYKPKHSYAAVVIVHGSVRNLE